jgi:hypothetical protein
VGPDTAAQPVGILDLRDGSRGDGTGDDKGRQVMSESRIEKVLAILEDAPELNPVNYDHEQVVELNAACNQAVLLLREIVAERDHATPSIGEGTPLSEAPCYRCGKIHANANISATKIREMAHEYVKEFCIKEPQFSLAVEWATEFVANFTICCLCATPSPVEGNDALRKRCEKALSEMPSVSPKGDIMRPFAPWEIAAIMDTLMPIFSRPIQVPKSLLQSWSENKCGDEKCEQYRLEAAIKVLHGAKMHRHFAEMVNNAESSSPSPSPVEGNDAVNAINIEEFVDEYHTAHRGEFSLIPRLHAIEVITAFVRKFGCVASSPSDALREKVEALRREEKPLESMHMRDIGYNSAVDAVLRLMDGARDGK